MVIYPSVCGVVSMSMVLNQPLIDVLAAQLRAAARHNSAVQVAPAAVLWTDEERQWQAAMPVIKQVIPELLELGGYNPATRTGPAIWIKCAIAGLADEMPLVDGAVPIIYLPGVSRKDLRAIEQCPKHLQPLAELQYRGCWWAYNPAGRDWSVTAFLTSERVGLNLDIAKDKRTQEAISTVLGELLESPVAALQSRRLETADFHALVVGDPIKDLLGWLNDPTAKQQQWLANKWVIFRDHCQQQYGFDPVGGFPEHLLSQLCAAERHWQPVWQRFTDTAHNLPGLLTRLKVVRPASLVDESSHFLSINLDQERDLENQLCALKNHDATSVRQGIRQLEAQHGKRRGWLWQRLGLAPWASILQALTQVVEYTGAAFSGPDPQTMAQAYQDKFWQADAAALQAMALAKEAQQQQVVADILALVYTPWLEQTTLNFQQLVQTKGYPGIGQVSEDGGHYQPKSQVVFFVDGLRFDTAQQLLRKLVGLAVKTKLSTHWSALPSLTATAKAAVSPITDLLTGQQDNDNFMPVLSAGGNELSSYYLRKTLIERGWQFLEDLDTGDPAGTAWIQIGDLDHLGHEQQRKLPLGIDAVLEEVAERVAGLLQAGWQHIRIVTDHGWLWVPDKLPKADIQKTAVRKRLARCAILKDNVETGHLKMHWRWNKNVTIAMAPGISVFEAGDYYHHGGLSLQECLTPVINVTAG